MSTSILVAYPITPAELALKVDAHRGHSFTTPALYREGVKAIGTLRELRLQIEERRKALKHDSLEYGRKVDEIAKQLFEIILAVELPLKEARKQVDDAKELAKREAAEAERKRLAAELAAQREAEEAVLREQRRVESEALAEQRRELERERQELLRLRQESDAVANEQKRLLDEERKQHAADLAVVKAQREAIEKEQRATQLAERMKAEAEEARINALEYEKQRAKRLAALAPDQDKLNQIARGVQDLIDAFDDDTFEAQSATDTYTAAIEDLTAIVETLTTWKARQQ